MKKKMLFGLLMITLVALPLFGACAEPAPAPAPAPSPAPAPAPAPEVIKLRYASDMPEFGAPSQFALHLINFVEKNSGGRVEFEVFHGGVLGRIFEMLNLVSTGATDMTLIIHPMFKEQLPLHNFPEYQVGSMAKAMDYVNKLNFDIPETAAMLEKENEANNVKGLRYHALGEGGLLAKMTFSSIADLKGKKLGSSKEQKAYAALGINIVSVSDTDMYESLSRGVCDVTAFPIEPIANNRWYEVTKCFIYDGLYHGGFQTLINLDTWNKLPADIQGIFEEAAKSAEAFSVEWDKTKTAGYEQTLKDAGIVVGRLPAADTENLFKLEYDMDVEDMLALAAKVGKTEEAKVILKHAEEITFGK